MVNDGCELDPGLFALPSAGSQRFLKFRDDDGVQLVGGRGDAPWWHPGQAGPPDEGTCERPGSGSGIQQVHFLRQTTEQRRHEFADRRAGQELPELGLVLAADLRSQGRSVNVSHRLRLRQNSGVSPNLKPTGSCWHIRGIWLVQFFHGARFK
jgi:hypothetical protein